MLKNQLEKLVGKGNVIDDAKTLQEFSRDQSLASPGAAWLVVKVKNTKEVEDVVKFANEKLVPLIPVSSPSGPRFRGDTIPSQGGIVVDLSGMDKIININRNDRIALIEPGVTFGQLEKQLRKNGLRAIKPLMQRSTKSVVASYLEREPVVVPKEHWDSTDPLVCTEVIFGNGDFFRTGSAAGQPRDIKKQIALGLTQCEPGGPLVTSMSRVIQGAQGTIGIVTWASVICGYLPDIEKTFFVTSDNLNSLIDMSYAISRRRLVQEQFLVNGFQLAMMMKDTKDEIKKLSEMLPPWILVYTLTANGMKPAEMMDYQEKDFLDIAKIFGQRVNMGVAGISGLALMKRLDNPPERYYKMNYRGNCQDVFFVTTLNRTPEFIKLMNEELRTKRYDSSETGIYLQPTVQGCNCHCEFNLPYDDTNATQRADMKNLLIGSSKVLAKAGAFFSRPYGPWADIAYGMNGEATWLLKKVKKALDPNGIMNPGKLCF